MPLSAGGSLRAVRFLFATSRLSREQSRRLNALSSTPVRKPMPVIDRLEGMLRAIAVARFRVGRDGPLWRVVTALHPRVESLFYRLGLAHQVRSLLDNVAEMRIEV